MQASAGSDVHRKTKEQPSTGKGKKKGEKEEKPATWLAGKTSQQGILS